MIRPEYRRAAIVAGLLMLVLAASLYWRGRGTPDAPRRVTVRDLRSPTVPLGRRVRPDVPAAAESTPAPTSTPIRLVPAVAGPDPSAVAGSFEGRVVSWATGVGVGGAEIVFSSEQGAATIRATADGGFIFRPAERGLYRLAVASAKGFLPFAPEWGRSPIRLQARPGIRVKGLILYLSPSVRYAGRVLDTSGKPVANAAVRLYTAGAEERALLSIPDRFTSGVDGTFVFSAPDFSVLEATAPGFQVGRARVDRAAQILHKLDIVIEPGEAAAPVGLSGRVVDVHGGPVIGAVVRAATLAHGARREYQTVSGADGRFRFASVAPGRYMVTATSEEWAPATAAASAGTTAIVLTMHAGASVAGRVVDDRGAPVAAFTVVVMRKVGPMRNAVVTSSSVFDGEGTFEVGGLDAGPYVIRAVAYGYPPAVLVDTNAVVAPGTPRSVTITMQRGGTLTGRVIDAETKAPIARAKVSVEGSVGSGPSALPLQSVAVTDATGQFELAGLPIGRASVVGTAAEHHSRIVGGLLVTPGARLGPLAIALTPVKAGETPGLELAGIGAALEARDEALVIQRVFDGSGAAGAGLVAGDAIMAVNGTLVTRLGMRGSIQAIRGPVGSAVQLTVRKVDGTVVDVVAIRRKIRA